MDQLLVYSPKTITFDFTLTLPTTTHLDVRNVSEHRIAYKVKTTDHRRYCVCPNAAIIEPHADMAIELTQQPMKDIPPDLDDCRDRFLLQVTRIDLFPRGDAGGDYHGFESVMDFWKTIPPDAPPDTLHKIKFGVVLKMADTSEERHRQQKIQTALDGSETSKGIVLIRSAPEPTAKQFIPMVATRGPSREEDTSLLDPDVVNRVVESPDNIRTLDQEQDRVKGGISSAGKPIQGNASSSFDSKQSGIAAVSPLSERAPAIDYTSIEYTRERALGIRTARREPMQSLDEPTRQRIAVERAGELVRTINFRQKDIDVVRRELSEARHKLSDARLATSPAYDVKYEVSDSSRIPYAQIAIMAIISGALLQLLV